MTTESQRKYNVSTKGKEHRKTATQKWRQRNPDRVKAWSIRGSLKFNFNISVETYNKMFDQQKGMCAICQQHQTQFKRRLAVDHCHQTDKIRGLLCDSCNLMLGHAKDNKHILQSAVDYLKRHE